MSRHALFLVTALLATRLIASHPRDGSDAIAVEAVEGWQTKTTQSFSNRTTLSRARRLYVCNNGMYYSPITKPKCLPCPPGFWCMQDTRTVRMRLAVPYVDCFDVIARGLQACAAGLYSTGGASSCLGCPAGTYSNSTACIDCSAGTFSLPNSPGCTPCDAGMTSSSSSGACRCAHRYDARSSPVQCVESVLWCDSSCCPAGLVAANATACVPCR